MHENVGVVSSYLSAILIDTNFLTNKNRNTITPATNSSQASLEFHVPFKNILIRWHLTFCLPRIFNMFMLREGDVC